MAVSVYTRAGIGITKCGGKRMYEQNCVPFAPSLIESMRSLGYSFSSAIADLIDNSISAKADEISIVSEPSADPWMVIFDNGCGMSKDELYEAMRYGSKNPLDKRKSDDLGRFGLGLKSASLSQCRRLVVVSKKDNVISAYSWDLDYVIEKGAWVLKCFSDEEIKEYVYVEMLDKVSTGTYILLENFDRVKESTADLNTTFNKNLNEMENHIALVFHRFIEEGLTIKVNGIKIEGRDPFLSMHPATQKKRESSFYINNEKITLKPFVLPHLSKLKQEDLDKLGGKERIRNEQGFYVYRNKRLIIWGTWFRLERKDELNKLARVRVDIPNSLDYMWAIDIKKSTASLPDIIKKNMFNAVYETVLNSEKVYTYRGRREKTDKNIEVIWEKIKMRDGYRYTINRKIPQLRLLAETMEPAQIKLMDSIIEGIEEAFPVNALYVDVAKGTIEECDEKEIEDVWEELQLQMDYVKSKGLHIVEYYKAFMNTEPYCNYEEIKKRIQEEIENNE